MPGGGCGGQRPYDAALRELEEETGLVAGTVHSIGGHRPATSRHRGAHAPVPRNRIAHWIPTSG
ncbi:NUDIX domain-containing protein [Streptomyces sp. NBC_00989]|uniref:NUDIX domain-containing protein n=1 Tax=Streptomyces sp. NBC_00989 TaxID=2903705 RepID=UPI00386D41ED